MDIAEIYPDIARGALVLTPNHRSAMQLREAFGRRARQDSQAVGPSPAIFAVDVWIRRQCDALQAAGLMPPELLLEPAQELLVWKAVIGASPPGDAFLNLEAAAKTVREAWQRMQLWEIDAGELRRHVLPAAPGAAPLEDAEAFLGWLERYRARCREQGLVSLSSLVKRCRELIESQRLAAPSVLILANFRDTPPLYARLLESLEKAAGTSRRFQSRARRPRLRRGHAPDPGSEAEAAAQWALELRREDPQARVGVICPDLHARRRELDRIFTAVFHPDSRFDGRRPDRPAFALSAADGLDAAPLIGTALDLLDLNQPVMNTLDFCRLLRSPFLLEAEAEADARAELEYLLRRRGEQRTALADLRFLALQEGKAWHCPALGRAMQALETLNRSQRGRRLAADWIPLLEARLACLGWPGERPRSGDEAAQLQQWYEVLSELQRWSFVEGPMELSGVLGLLRTLLRATRLHGYLPRAGVQVLSPVEADGLQFDHLWFMGLNEGRWPPAPRPNPFLPLALQKRRQLPDADVAGQLDRARELLASLLDGCGGEAVLSWPEQNAEGQLKPCAMLEGFPAEVEELAAVQAGLHPYSRAAVASVPLETLHDTPALPVPENETVTKGGTALLAAQAACPFKGFAVYRLDARELPALTFGLPAFARGTMLHLALEAFWKALRGREDLLALDTEAVARRLDEVVEAALAECARHYPQTMRGGFRELEGRRLRTLLQQWLERERERGGFTIAALEHKLQWRHSRLVLNFRIDRVERLDGGGIGLVDYKSAKAEVPRWLDGRQDKPQLLLYLLAAEKDASLGLVDAALFAQVNIEDAAFKGIASREEISPGLELARQRGLPPEMGWEELKRFWEECLQALADEFLQGRLAVMPKSPRSCQRCHLDAFCRIGDLSG